MRGCRPAKGRSCSSCWGAACWRWPRGGCRSGRVLTISGDVLARCTLVLAQRPVVQLAQLALEHRQRRRVEKAEGYAALLAFDRMVQTVRLIQPLEIAVARHVAQRPAVMDQPVMSDEIEKTVGRHPGADPFQRVITGRA